MNTLLQPGDDVQVDGSRETCEVESFIGGGTQGEVYRVRLGQERMALKWYFPSYLKADPDQRRRLEQAIRIGAPDPRFLWPQSIAINAYEHSFGYLMPLREERFSGLVDYLAGRASASFTVKAIVGFNLADAFYKLHTKGLCYRDISWNNVFFDPKNGDVLVPDNDNVDIDGKPGIIAGTPKFMAPEIVRGEAQPSSHTDRHSLAVLLFLILMLHHPLDGRKELQIRCFDLPARRKLYGKEPLFIFDPNDNSNAPDPDEQQIPLVYWALYPRFIRDLFTQAFTEGLEKPKNGRVMENQWRKAMVRLSDSVMYCSNCGRQNLYDYQVAKQGKSLECWKCSQDIRLPPRMKVGKDVVMLHHDAKLYKHHISSSSIDLSTPVASVSQHPSDPRIWGLVNDSQEKWVVRTPSGELVEVPPGKSARLAHGMTIDFGQREGKIAV